MTRRQAAVCLWVDQPSVLSSLTEKLLCWFEVRSLICQLKKISFLCPEKLLGCFSSLLQVIVQIALWNCSQSVRRVWLNLSSEYSPVHPTVQDVAAISYCIINKLITYLHWHPYTLRHVWQMMCFRSWAFLHPSFCCLLLLFFKNEPDCCLIVWLLLQAPSCALTSCWTSCLKYNNQKP